MKHKLINTIREFALNIGATNGMNSEDILKQFAKDQKHINLIERIKAIRNSGWYIPDYNKPKVFTEIKILYNAGEKEENLQPISYNTRISCERPVDFGNNMEKWINSIHADNISDPEKRKKREEEFQEAIDERYRNVDLMLNKFMRVD